MKEMAKRIVMITFTDDAANQMEDKIKQHFNNYYLLTGDGDCLVFINQIEGMQISTIHSYAKKIISVLGLELGYGIDVSVTSGDYKTKQIIADLVDQYISQKQKDYGDSYVKKLGMPVYLINKDILNILTRLHNQSIDVSQLKADNFGEMVSGGIDGEFHKLIQDIIPKVEVELDAYLKKQNKIHSVTQKWLRLLTGYKQQEKIRVGFFDPETASVRQTEMYVEGFKAKLKKDTSYKGLWNVSFTLKEL